jgi:hypothetical protein
MVHRHIHVRTYIVRTCMCLWTIVQYDLLSIYVLHVCVCEPLYCMVYCLLRIYIYIDNKPYSKMVHRHIHVRTYIDNKPYSTMVQRHIHVRTYKDNTCMFLWTIVLHGMVYYLYMYVHVCVCEPMYWMVYCLYMYVHVYVYIDNKHYNIQWFTDTYMYVHI